MNKLLDQLAEQRKAMGDNEYIDAQQSLIEKQMELIEKLKLKISRLKSNLKGVENARRYEALELNGIKLGRDLAQNDLREFKKKIAEQAAE